VERGELSLATLELRVPWEPSEVKVSIAGGEVPADWQWQEGTLTVRLPETCHLEPGQELSAVARVA
jgi:hypothetical protein